MPDSTSTSTVTITNANCRTIKTPNSVIAWMYNSNPQSLTD